MNKQNQIIFQKFLNNELAGQALSDFEQKLIDDTSFKSEFEMFKSMDGFLTEKAKYGNALDIIREVGEKDKGLKVGINQEQNLNKKRTIPIYRKWGFRVAASVAFLLAVGSYFMDFGKNKFEKFNVVYEEPIWPGSRNESNALVDAIINYRNNVKAIAFDSIYSSTKINKELKFYWLAEIHLLENNIDSSLYYIHLAKTNKDKEQRLIFIEGLCYLKQENLQRFNKYRSELPENIDQYYLKKIDKFTY